MRIRTISVTRLFGMFDHTVGLNRGESITIVYGPNGYGKTYLLNAVNDLFALAFDALAGAPFETLAVGLDDGRLITVKRTGLDRPGIGTITVTGSGGGVAELSRGDFAREFGGKIAVRFIDTERLMRYSDSRRDRPVITICAESMKRLLSDGPPAGETAGKIELLANIVDSRFNHKRIIVDPSAGFTFETTTGVRLRPEQLSSGEQHAVIILFELLFNIAPGTLILIDEPELSLHIFWQQQFIADLEKIGRFTDFDILIATHSPQIIHDRWDLAVELGGPAA